MDTESGGDQIYLRKSIYRSCSFRAMDVLFICPRPIGLASAEEGNRGNMFPMNVMGQLDDGYLGFGLQAARSPSHLVNRTRRIALSTIPMQQGDLGYMLGPNHSKANGIEWKDLPFKTKRSHKHGIPIPEFAVHVREVEVEALQALGSHTFFVGRIIEEERFFPCCRMVCNPWSLSDLASQKTTR